MPIGGICAGQLYLGGDGKLWHWDIFNQRIGTGAEHYATPMKPSAPLQQGFALRIAEAGTSRDWELDRAHWREVSFTGEYPIGYVEYRDPDSPASVRLEAFSPFIPLNEDDSSLPATVLEFTVKNERSVEIEVELAGWLENAVCLHSGHARAGLRRNRLVRRDGLLFLECSAEEAPANSGPARPDIVFEDFEGETYASWVVTGTAFGAGPVEIANIPSYQGDVGGKGKRVVNSHASAPGKSVEEKDSATGTLTSRPFTIDRYYITFLIGGGAHKDRTCMNLLVDGKVTLSATGKDNNAMGPASWDVRHLAGKTATLQIVDQEQGGWGNIGVDDIVFSDRPREPLGPLAAAADFGTLGLALIESKVQSLKSKVEDSDGGQAVVPNGTELGRFFTAPTAQAKDGAAASRPFGEKLIGSLTRKMKLAPGASAKAVFVLTWHMPNLKLPNLPGGRHYTTRFASAYAVAQYVEEHFSHLSSQTRLWHDTWYDSTLRSWRPQPATGSVTAAFTAGRASAVAKGPAATSGTTPMPWRAFSPSWSVSRARRSIWGWRSSPMAPSTSGASATTFQPLMPRRGSFSASCASTRCPPTMPSSNATGRASSRPSSGSSPRTAMGMVSSKATSITRSTPIGMVLWRG
jgi:hypothetical protein